MRIFLRRILILDVRRVCPAVTLIVAREPKNPSNGLVCDLHTDPHPNGALLSSASFGVLRASRPARGT
jgi:hypothetical protein